MRSKKLFCLEFLLTVLVVSVSSSHSNLYGKYEGINEIKKRYLKDDTDEQIFGIYGGKEVPIEKVKYIGSVSSTDITTSKRNILGAGVLLNNKWVLTAAFNVWSRFQKDVQVRFGSASASEGGIVINAAKVITHPKYTGQYDYDIALLKLQKPIKFSSKIGAASGLASKLPKTGVNTLVSGFGYVTGYRIGGKLRQVNLPYLDIKSCKHYYEQYPEVTNVSLCTSKESVGPCAYDFGAPLIYKNKILGIFSGTYGCGDKTYPGVYADVTQFKKWILDTMKKNSVAGEDILPSDLENDEDTK